jgi:hypothetical protein
MSDPFDTLRAELVRAAARAELTSPRRRWQAGRVFRDSPVRVGPDADRRRPRHNRVHVALRYLAERQGRSDLRGANAAQRAWIDGLLDTLSLELRPALWEAEEPVVYGVELPPDERAPRHTALVAAAVAYDRLLAADGPYALGAFTIADCAIAGRCFYLEQLGLEHDVAPRLQRVIAAAQSRSCWDGVMGPA